MDLGAVKDAPADALAWGAVAAARNACGLVEDAELLSGAGRLARAYSLAGLAVEEVGKVGSLAALAAMPENLRARAPVGRMLEWHQMKLVAGQLIAAVPFSGPGWATTFVTMPVSEVADILDRARAFTEDIDRLKQRGLYVDVDRSGQVREPSEVNAAEVREQLGRARQAASAASALLDPGAPAWLAKPGAAGVEFSRALVNAFGETGRTRSCKAAADVLLNTATEVHGLDRVNCGSSYETRRRTLAGNARLIGRCRVPTLRRMTDPSSYDVYGDGSVVVVLAGGHTTGSVVVFVTLPAGNRYAFIGDLTWQLEGVRQLAERPLLCVSWPTSTPAWYARACSWLPRSRG